MISLFIFIKSLSVSKLLELLLPFIIGILIVLFFIFRNKSTHKTFIQILLIPLYVVSLLGGVYFAVSPVMLLSDTDFITYLIVFGAFGFVMVKFLSIKFEESFNLKRILIVLLPWLFAFGVSIFDINPTYKIFIAKTVIATSLILFSGFWLTFSFGLFGSTTLSDMRSSVNFLLTLAFIIWSAQTIIKPAWTMFLQSIGKGLPGYILVSGLIIQILLEATEHRKLYGKFYF